MTVYSPFQLMTMASPYSTIQQRPQQQSKKAAKLKPAERAALILQQHKEKPFVKRILEPEAYPSLDYGDGYRATHQMSWGKVDGKFLVYPNIMLEDSGGLLERKGGEAFREAIKRGNYIEFGTAEEADWFSKNYKSVWPEG